MKLRFFQSLKGKFLLITLIMSLLVAIITFSLSYMMSVENLQNNQLHSAETNLQFLKNEIDDSLTDVDTLVQWCCTNSYIVDYIKTPYTKDNYSALVTAADNHLSETYISNPASSYISRVVIANTDSSKYLQRISSTLYSADKNMVKTLQSLPYYEELLNAPSYNFSLGVQQDSFRSHEDLMLPIIRPVYSPYNNDVIGFCYLQVSLTLFTAPLQAFSARENLPVFLSIGDELYKITKDTIEPMKSIAKTIPYETDSVTTSYTNVYRAVDSSDYSFYVSCILRAEECCISLPVSSDVENAFFKKYFNILLIILLLIIINGVVLFFFLSHTVGQPVNLLKSQLRRVAQGNFEPNPYIEWDNEFGDIGHHINLLASDISLLMEQRIAFETQKKDYEYQILQSQINPHFLYNTLNSIKWMAIAQKSTGIAEMTTALSHLLKNIAKGSSSIVSLRDEITLLDDYFTIQKYRYGGTVTMEYRIEDETLLNNQILRFTLQPIVENAIFHGIEPKGQHGHIDIHIYRTPDFLMEIDILDDGVGMTQEMIEKVLTDDTTGRSDFFKQIGIGSVNRRLQYNFGSEYGLTIESRLGEYTLMKIIVPSVPMPNSSSRLCC